MNRMSFIFCFLFFLASTLIAQDILTVEENFSQEPATIKFTTTSGLNIPLFNFISSETSNLGDVTLIVNTYEEIGNAPLTLSIKPGHYTFRMYKEGVGKNISLNLQGGESQEWELTPRGERLNVSLAAAGIGTIGTLFASGMLWWAGVEEDNYARNPDFFDKPSISSSTMQVVTGVFVSTALTGLITTIIQLPKAKRIK